MFICVRSYTLAQNPTKARCSPSSTYSGTRHLQGVRSTNLKCPRISPAMLGLWASSYFPRAQIFKFRYREAGPSRLTELPSHTFLSRFPILTGTIRGWAMPWSPRANFGRTSGRNWSHAFPQNLGLLEGNIGNPSAFSSSFRYWLALAHTLFQGRPAAPSSRPGRAGVGGLDGSGHLGEILQLREAFRD